MDGHGLKIGNKYAALLSFYERIPKAVFGCPHCGRAFASPQARTRHIVAARREYRKARARAKRIAFLAGSAKARRRG